MKLKINVTQELIDKASRHSKCDCPIARAVVMESVNHGAAVFTGAIMAEASIDHEKGRLFFRQFSAPGKGDKPRWAFVLPEEATEFIRRRDAQEPIQPFSFVVNATEDELKPFTGSKDYWEFDPNAGRKF